MKMATVRMTYCTSRLLPHLVAMNVHKRPHPLLLTLLLSCYSYHYARSSHWHGTLSPLVLLGKSTMSLTRNRYQDVGTALRLRLL